MSTTRTIVPKDASPRVSQPAPHLGEIRLPSQPARQSVPFDEVSPLALLIWAEQELTDAEYDEHRRFANQGIRHGS